MKRKNLKRITIFSILLSFVFTGGIFAYWASSVSGALGDDTPLIQVGVGLPAETTLSLAETQRTQGALVPAGYETTGSVSQIVITYEVELVPNQEAALGAEAIIEVTHGTLASPLLNVNIVIPNSVVVVGGAKALVYVSITLTEPANQTEYATVANLEFDIPLTFTATI